MPVVISLFSRVRRHPFDRIIAIAALVALGACSGGGSTSGMTPSSPQQPGQTVPTGNAMVTFQMQWASPSSASSISRRRPFYLPATALSASIGLITAPDVTSGIPIQYLNSPTATLTFSAPTGLDTFVIQTYDEQNGLGNVLSKAYETKTVSGGIANVVSATLNGVIATLNLAVNGTFTGGTASTLSVTSSGLDADGNVIVGPGDFNTPIELSISDPANSGTLSLTTKAIQVPGVISTLKYTGGSLWSAMLVASATGAPPVSIVIAPKVGSTSYTVTTSASSPQWITLGPNGYMWFTEGAANRIGYINAAGSQNSYLIPTASANPQGIITASNGNVWFTEFNSSKIGEVTSAGAFTQFTTLFAGDGPQLLVDRGDGNVWYTGFSGDHVGFQGVTSGVSGETTSPTASSYPFGIATAPDNNLYFTESGVGKIGQIANLFSTINEMTLPAGAQPEGIVRGPDGNLWVADYGLSQIYRIAPYCFCITSTYPTVTPNAFPVGIAVGTDGALWFTENGLNRIGRVTTSGTVTEYSVGPTSSSLGLRGIAAASNGTIWFVESSANAIGKLTY